VEALSILYPMVKISVRNLILLSIEYLFSSQWLTPKSHGVWDDPELEFVFSLVENPRFKRHLSWKADHFGVKNVEVGGIPSMERVTYVFSKGGEHL
jgi:hypothetical protein